MSWFNESLKTIDAVISQKGYANVTLKDIGEAYPFGERKRFPYKQWLKARKLRAKQLGLVSISSPKPSGLFLPEFQNEK